MASLTIWSFQDLFEDYPLFAPPYNQDVDVVVEGENRGAVFKFLWESWNTSICRIWNTTSSMRTWNRLPDGRILSFGVPSLVIGTTGLIQVLM